MTRRTLTLETYELCILHMLVGNRLAEVDNIVADGSKYKDRPDADALRQADANYRNDLNVLWDKLDKKLSQSYSEEE
jgi:hypothetical protein